MATVTLRRSDLFPVGTTVGIHPVGSQQQGGPPTAAEIANAAVDGAGLLTVTSGSIGSYTTYVAIRFFSLVSIRSFVLLLLRCVPARYSRHEKVAVSKTPCRRSSSSGTGGLHNKLAWS